MRMVGVAPKSVLGGEELPGRNVVHGRKGVHPKSLPAMKNCREEMLCKVEKPKKVAPKSLPDNEELPGRNVVEGK